MGWLDRFSSKSTVKAKSNDGPELLDGALETLAATLRTLGQVYFPMGGNDEYFTRECESFSQHVLTGTPLEDEEGPTVGGRRAWAQVRRFVKKRREEERDYVNSRFDGFKDAIFGLMRGMRQVTEVETGSSDTIEGSLAGLEEALRTEDPEGLRHAVNASVASIRETLEHQRQVSRAEMKALCDTIAAINQELIAARHESETDPLTELFNRRAFDRTADNWLNMAAITENTVALLMIDLDDFKDINDIHGHKAGDLVLRGVADCLVRSFPGRQDFVARFGGDEFAVMLFDANDQRVHERSTRLLQNLRALRVTHNDADLKISASVGYSLSMPSDDIDSLTGRADDALYEVKRGGKNNLRMSSASFPARLH